MPEAEKVNSTFAGIAGRYDLTNRVMSGGLDIAWRRRMVREVAKRNPKKVLDLATGSGDVAFDLRKGLGPEVEIEGIDFCQPMLDEAEAKKRKMSGCGDITFRQGDILDLPVPDGSVDVVTISWGLRNLEDRHKGLQEMHRVLKPGGYLYILEFSQPNRWLSPAYYFYLKRVLPIISGALTGKRDAYHYLAGSVEIFPDKEELGEEIRAAGFEDVRAIPLMFSIEAIHEARA